MDSYIKYVQSLRMCVDVYVCTCVCMHVCMCVTSAVNMYACVRTRTVRN